MRLRRVPRVKTLRRASGLTQEEFAKCYEIPIGTLRDWEQDRTEPDETARAYLDVIARDPVTAARLERRRQKEGRRTVFWKNTLPGDCLPTHFSSPLRYCRNSRLALYFFATIAAGAHQRRRRHFG